jgi:hypothetical protein
MEIFSPHPLHVTFLPASSSLTRYSREQSGHSNSIVMLKSRKRDLPAPRPGRTIQKVTQTTRFELSEWQRQERRTARIVVIVTQYFCTVISQVILRIVWPTCDLPVPPEPASQPAPSTPPTSPKLKRSFASCAHAPRQQFRIVWATLRSATWNQFRILTPTR